MNKTFLLFAGAAIVIQPAAAQPLWSIKQIGATYVEAPPGRDKSLAPQVAFGSLEKVEVHAVVAFKDRIVTDTPFMGSVSTVKATANLAAKTTFELGSAEVGNFRKVSDDRKKTLFSIGVSRLPDHPVTSVTFSGLLRITVAKGLKQKSGNLEPKVGSRVELGLGNVTVESIDANSITFKGGEPLNQIAELRFIKADGSKAKGERRSYSSQGGSAGTVVSAQWSFDIPIGAGKIEASIYDGLETLEVPVKLTVAKPY
jgi:hypothetical protein